MKLEKIKFENKGNEPYPDKITVEMTVAEALWLAVLLGNFRHGEQNSGIWGCLVGGVFNRYWDGGVDEAREHIPVTNFPGIVYEDDVTE